MLKQSGYIASHMRGGLVLAIARGNFALTQANKRSQVSLFVTKTKQKNVFLPSEYVAPEACRSVGSQVAVFILQPSQDHSVIYSSCYIS